MNKANQTMVQQESSDKSINSVYIGLGANLNEPQDQIIKAIDALNKLPFSHLIKSSSLYQTAPMGPQDQNDYINAVVLLETHLEPIALLDELQKIERSQGRIRKEQRWGPRTLDLDILLYNDQHIHLERLEVPHYGLQQRNFVLLPLFEITSDLILPDGKILSELVANINKQGIKKL